MARAAPVEPAAQAQDLGNALRAVAREDRAAFAQLYRLTCGKLFGICLRICKERSAAEDVLHDVYLTIWRRAGTYRPGRASPIGWLATIARNRSIDWVRSAANRRHAAQDSAGELVDDLPDPETMAVASSEQAKLHLCLNQLDERSRAAIRAAFFNGQSYRELADGAGMPLATMKSVIRRGLGRLRRCLDV